MVEVFGRLQYDRYQVGKRTNGRSQLDVGVHPNIRIIHSHPASDKIDHQTHPVGTVHVNRHVKGTTILPRSPSRQLLPLRECDQIWIYDILRDARLGKIREMTIH